jgi:hypothetical protein
MLEGRMGRWLELGSAIGSVSFSLDLLVFKKKKVFPTVFFFLKELTNSDLRLFNVEIFLKIEIGSSVKLCVNWVRQSVKLCVNWVTR